MKKVTIIAAAVLTLQAGILFAGNETKSVSVANESTTITLALLAPTTPGEATFEEMTMVDEIASLVPVTPAEASFEDLPSEITSLIDLAPLTPAVADFEDAVEADTMDCHVLAPRTPLAADFE